MQNSRVPPFSEAKRKKIPAPKQQPLTQLPPRIGKKASTRRKQEQFYAISHQPEMSNSDSSPGNEYRALRRKYLLLEEESFALERELKEAEDEVKALEGEKFELLDKLVVMEASLPATFCLSHGDECCNRSPTTKSSLFPCHSLAVKKNLMGHSLHYERSTVTRRLVVTAATEGSRKSKESQPSWANPDSDEPPPWARDEGRSSTSQESVEIPFYVYLLASAITAIAAIGSVFEYTSKNPVFGVLESDSIFYAPVLGFFAFTGIPTSEDWNQN
ncbi:unnamed protein product, partial [Thlaspi arvense]